MTPNLDVTMRGSVGKRVAANTGLMVGARGLGAIIGLLTLIILINTLDKPEAGRVLFLHSYMLFFAEVATFQSWQALIRFGTDDVRDKDHTKFLGLTRFCISLDALSAVLAYVAAIALFGLLVLIAPIVPGLSDSFSAGEGGIRGLFVPLALYCTLVLFNQHGASIGVFRVFDKFKVLALHALVMPVLRLIGAIIVVLNGGGMIGFLMAWYAASLIGYVVLPILAIIELKARHIWTPLWQAKSGLSLKRKGLWPFVWKSNADSTLATGTTHLPSLLVTPLLGEAFLPIFKLAEEIAKLLSEGVLLLDRVIYPEFARLVSEGRGRNLYGLVLKSAVIALAIGLIFSGILALFGPGVIAHFFGAGFEDTTLLAILLVLGASMLGISAPIYPVLYAVDRPGLAIIARGAGLLAYVILCITLCLSIGSMGPGWAALIGNGLAVIIGAAMVKRVLTKLGDAPMLDIPPSSD